MTIEWTPERRAEHSRVTKEGLAAKKQRELSRPCHVDRWLEAGVVEPGLRPLLEARASQVESMIDDLGGPDHVSEMQRRILDGWLQAQVAADVEFSRLVRDPKRDVPERLTTCLNTARSALTSVGLDRIAKDVTTLEAHVAEHYGENGERRDREHSTEDDRASEANVEDTADA